MIPKIIHYCWFGGKEMPASEKELIIGWKELNPDFEIKLWNEENSPMDLPYLKNAHKLSNWANLSNYMRLYALYEEGGIYMDTDFLVRKNLDPLLKNKCFLGIENEGKDFYVNNAFFGAEKKHPFVKELLVRITKQFDGSERANLSSPHLATHLLREKGMSENKFQTIEGVTIYDYDYFYPLPYDKKYDSENYKNYVTENSFAVHLWSESWLSLEDYKDKGLYLGEELDKLKIQFTIKESELLKAEEVNGSNKKVINELKGIGVVLNSSIADKEHEVNGLKKAIEDKELAIISEQEQRNLLSDEIYSKNEKLSQAEKDIFRINISLRDKDELVKRGQEKNNDLKEVIVAQKNEIQRMEDSFELIKQSLEEKDNKVVELSKVRGKQQEQIAQLNLEIELLKNEAQLKNESYFFLTEANTELKNKVLLQDTLIRNLELVSTMQIQELEKSSLENQKLTKKNVKLKKKTRNELNKTEQSLAMLIESNRLMTSENESLKSRQTFLNNALKDKEDLIGQKIAENKSIIANKSTNDNALKKWEESHDKLTKENETLTTKIKEEKQSVKTEKKLVASQSESLAWYKATYQDRSLLGVLKTYFTREKAIDFAKQTSKKVELKKLPHSIKADADNETLCAVINHNFNDNARVLKNRLSKYYNTIVIDSGSTIKNEDFINLPNVYYSGLYNYAYNYAKENVYKNLFLICSDVEFEAEEIKKMHTNLSKIDTNEIGIYSPSSTGRSHAHCKKQFEKGLRVVDFAEGFVFFANMELLDVISEIDSDTNLYGWGIDLVQGYSCKLINKLCVIDDEVTLYHPEETGYSSEKADIHMNNWINSHNEKSDIYNYLNKKINLIREGNGGKYKISVIVPCYNQAHFLKESVYSIFNQTYTNFEIIIVNDGSTDNTHEIATELANMFPQIKYINQKNKGLSGARNTGLDNATGDLIQFLDADDYLSINKFMDAVYHFSLDEELSVVYSKYLCYADEDHSKTWTYSRVELENDPQLDLIKNWETELSIPVHCFIYKAELIGEQRFDETLPNHEDWEFHLRISSLKPSYHFSNEATAYYRISENSMSQNNHEEMLRGKYLALASAFDQNYFNNNTYNSELLNRIEVKLVVGIFVSENNQERIEFIRNTWVKNLKELNISYYFVLENPNSQELNIDEDILYVPFNNNNLTKKLFNFYSFINDHTDYDYVYRLDAKCFLNVQKLYSSAFWQYDYFGKLEGKTNLNSQFDNYIGEWGKGNSGYFVSRKSLDIISTNKDFIYGETHADKAIGDTLRKAGVTIQTNENYKALNFRKIKVKDIEIMKLTVITHLRNKLQYLQLDEELKTDMVIMQSDLANKLIV